MALLATVVVQQQSGSTAQGPVAPAGGATEEPYDVVFSRVHKLKPPHYSGDPEPAVLDEWVSCFTKIFEVSHCPDVHKVGISAYYLTESANVWWQNKRTEIGRTGAAYTWDLFLTDLRREFFQEHVADDRRREFALLEQGSMSVTEYYSRFRDLMRYDPHAQADLPYLIHKFKEGCIGPVRGAFATGKPATLGEAYERAVYMERTLVPRSLVSAPSPTVSASPAPRRDQDRRGGPARRD